MCSWESPPSLWRVNAGLGLVVAVLAFGTPAAGQSESPPPEAMPSTASANSAASSAASSAATTAAVPGLDSPVARSADGQTTIRAFRLTEPIRLDGILDEHAYATTPPIDGFVQQEPREGEPASEPTEVWVFFDDSNIYVSARLHDSEPARMVANEMRRDHRGIFQGESFTVALDTYHDRRNGYYFQTNPLGALRDALITDEGNANNDWQTVWDVKASRNDQGWIFEMAIPFKSLRFGPGREQVWGINMVRVVKWKNETDFVTPMPAAYGPGGLFKFSIAATLVGLEAPAASRNLEIKPYVISDVTTDLTATPGVSNDLGGDAGFDLKYGLTSGLTADVTYNTEFAQVEEDEQQVNLTRFSLFFPEKREFFLEGQGIFGFGGGVARGAGGGGRTSAPTLTPVLFFSRQIGLESGQAVPIVAGGRVTGRTGDYTVGLLNISTGDSERVGAQSANFSVVRLRRDILRRSTIGVIATNRSPRANGVDTNQTYGVDANLAFFENLEVKGYYARTRTPGTDDGASYLGEVQYNADRYGFVYQHLALEEGFNPEVGFLRRDEFRRHYTGVRFSPRPAGASVIRRFNYEAALDYITTLDDSLETREGTGAFSIEFQSGDRFDASLIDSTEVLADPFTIASGVTIPVGRYQFRQFQTAYNLGTQRRLSGRLNAAYGSFFDGTLTEVGYGGRVELTSQVSIEPRVSLNWIDLPYGDFTRRLVSTRATYTMTPRSFASALVQYNSGSNALSANVRFRWEYRPGSDLFVVFSEGRTTDVRGRPALQNRGFVVKLTRLFRI